MRNYIIKRFSLWRNLCVPETRPKLNIRCLWALKIIPWAQEQFQKSFSITVQCVIHKCRLKLYRIKKKQYVDIIQKHSCLPWAKAHLQQPEAKWKFLLWSGELKLEIFFQNMNATPAKLKRRGATRCHFQLNSIVFVYNV